MSFLRNIHLFKIAVFIKNSSSHNFLVDTWNHLYCIICILQLVLDHSTASLANNSSELVTISGVCCCFCFTRHFFVAVTHTTWSIVRSYLLSTTTAADDMLTLLPVQHTRNNTIVHSWSCLLHLTDKLLRIGRAKTNIHRRHESTTTALPCRSIGGV